MDHLAQSCKNFSEYPQNLVHHDALSYNLKMYLDRLRNQGSRLFDEPRAAVDFLDYNDKHEEFRSSCVTTLCELKHLLREALRPENSDPQCRFIFIHAPHSRAALRISHDMLSFLLSYHQVMPSFLDFVLPFGKQEYAQDFHFSGLREESRLGAERNGLNIPQLGRSGNELSICYNIRSVEQSRGQIDLPWSIRQSAVYHAFDLRTGRSTWINVKGNKLIKNRILEASVLPPFSKVKSISEAFSASLAVHLILCDWAGENWRWYINDLEDKLQVLTRNALTAQVDEQPVPELTPIAFSMSPRAQTGSFPVPQRTFTGQSSRSPRVFTQQPSPLFPSRTTTLMAFPETSTVSQNDCYGQDRWTEVGTEQSQSTRWSLRSLYYSLVQIRSRFGKQNATREPCIGPASKEKLGPVPRSPCERLTPPELPPALLDAADNETGENFTFGDLQRIQYIEEKAQEALLVLRLNTEILEELRLYYSSIFKHTEFPEVVRNDCQTDLAKFDKCVLGVEKDLRMLQSRTETLLHLLANRNSLLNGILQYRSVKANEFFAKKAQISADHMETMTIEMHEIAQKTKQETVSMRVITSVTLFFLPSTFIATFMSTDILKFSDNTQDFQISGLKMYLAIALPMTALTFLAWFIIFRWTKRTGISGREGDEDVGTNSV